MKVLIVEDSEHLRKYLNKALKREGHTVDLAEDGASGLWFAESFRYDVIVLDIMLPKISGLEVLEKLREKHIHTHIILLTALASKEEVVIGLKSGADDYIVKPFDTDELLARIEVLGRRPSQWKPNTINVGALSLDTGAKTISVNDVILKFAHREFVLLSYLMTHSGKVISRERLEEQVYDINQSVMSNSINSAISVIRKTLAQHDCAELLKTRRGLGYILSVQE